MEEPTFPWNDGEPEIETLRRALDGRYEVEEQVGRGGMATVYRAVELQHPRPVAIKVLHAPFVGSSIAERFDREIRLLARLQHPFIVPLYGSGEAYELPYYVTAYVAGRSLGDRLHPTPGECRRLPFAEAWPLVRDVAEALDCAHEERVVHRDVKPDNILLSHGHALVADFGIAHAIERVDESWPTRSGITLGTPAYMSPEQLAADPAIDGRSDIYSLAIVLYETLAGVLPFYSPVLLCVDNAQKVTGQPHLLADHGVDDVPPGVEAAIRRALAFDPDDRFRRATEFARELARHVPAGDGRP